MKKKNELLIETSWGKLFFLTFIIIMIAGFLAILIVSLTPINPLGCDKQINESFINGTKVGYNFGAIDTSKLVLDMGILPISINESEIRYLNLTSKEILIQYLNLSKQNEI